MESKKSSGVTADSGGVRQPKLGRIGAERKHTRARPNDTSLRNRFISR
jgi:hypothetical protein